MTRWLRVIRNWFRRDRLGRDIDDELAFHLEMRERELFEQGLPPKQARREARMAFGNAVVTKEDTRGIWIAAWLETAVRDVGQSLRQLRNNPAFALTALLSLALGIGINTAIFSLVDHVLLKPLPFESPNRLVVLWESKPEEGKFSWQPSPANFLDWQEQNDVFESLAAACATNPDLTGNGEPARLTGRRLTSNFLSTLGVQPIIGSGFHTSDDRPGSDAKVLLGYDFWRLRFDSDPGIVGETLRLDGQHHTVLGVLPENFRLFPEVDVYFPNPFKDYGTTRPSDWVLYVIGRLKPDVTLRHAHTSMGVIAQRLAARHPQWNEGWEVRVVPLRQELLHQVQPSLMTLGGAAVLVLLLACANVSVLLLVRAAFRQQEFAVRAALGAGRLRLIRESLTGSLVLAVLGGAAGLLCAQWGLRLLEALLPKQLFVGIMGTGYRIPFNEISLDWRMFGAAFTLSLFCALLLGTLPAVLGSRTQPGEALRWTSGRTTGALARSRILGSLIVGQIALSLILVTAAGLLAHSYWKLTNEDPGYEPERVLRVRVSLPSEGFLASAPRAADGTPLQRITTAWDATVIEMLQRFGAIPGVEATSAASPYYQRQPVRLDGEEPLINQSATSAPTREVTPGFFQTLGISLLRGRDFNVRDSETSPPVAILNASMVQQYWPGREVLGRKIILPWFDLETFKMSERAYEIVGIAGDMRYFQHWDPARTVYVPYAQTRRERSATNTRRVFHMTFLVRSGGEKLTESAPIRAAVRQVAHDAPITLMGPLEDFHFQYAEGPRFYLQLIGFLTLASLILALIGTYGVVNLAAKSRIREIGIRQALGARATDVLWLVFKQGMALTFTGVALGLVAAVSALKVLGSMIAELQAEAPVLYKLEPTDPATLIVATLALSAVSLAASYIPARRAATVDPIAVLRHE